MAGAFPNNKEITIKMLEPVATGKTGQFYWDMVDDPAPKDIFKVAASKDMKVRELKAAIAKAKGIDVETQRLMFFGGVLADGRSLVDCGFTNTDDPLLHLIPKVA